MNIGRFVARAVVAVLAGAPALAAAYYVSADVPTDLAGVICVPSQVVRYDGTTHGLALDLPDDVGIDALHKMDGGAWLFSADAPFTVSGTTYDPRDVVRLSGTAYSRYFDGAAARIPEGVDLDALFLLGGDAGNLVFGVDVPTTVGKLAVEPADLVEVVGPGTFRMYFDASTATSPIPPSVNVVAADVRAGLLVLTFDVPVALSGSAFVPGELVSWDGERFALYSRDPAWPEGSVVGSMAFLAEPGEVLATLRVAKSAADPRLLELTWKPSCSAGAEDYGIYEGSIGSWSSHAARVCTDDGGDLREIVRPGAGNRYYLVAAHNANDEGSLGRRSNGEERPVGETRCAATQSLSPCP